MDVAGDRELAGGGALYFEGEDAGGWLGGWGELLPEEGSELCEVGVDDHGLGDGAVAGPAELVHEMAEMIEILLLLIPSSLIHDGQLHLTEQRRPSQPHINQKVLITCIHPILNPIDGKLGMLGQILKHLLNIGQSPLTLTPQQVRNREGYELHVEEGDGLFEGVS